MIEVEVNHADLLGAPRSQGRRPTCLAFAASDLNAFANMTPPLSVEYMCHYAAAHQDWQPGDGFTMEQILAAVENPGQPEEKYYPYNSNPDVVLLQSPPSNLSPLYTGKSKKRDLSLFEVVSYIRQGQAVGVVVSVTRSLYYPKNDIVEFDSYVIPDQYHAMVAIGVGTHYKTNETYILLRNSWGKEWGIQGHAWLPERYLELHMHEGFFV